MSIHDAIDKGYRKALGLGSDVPQEPANSGADYIITALEAAGYAIAPKEPTEEMIAAGRYMIKNSEAPSRFDLAAEVYRAMIEARPK